MNSDNYWWVNRDCVSHTYKVFMIRRDDGLNAEIWFKQCTNSVDLLCRPVRMGKVPRFRLNYRFSTSVPTFTEEGF